MKVDYITVRYGELTLKGRNRGRFEAQMFRQIKNSLRHLDGLEFEKTYARAYIKLNGADYDQAAESLRRVFGIHSFSPVIRADNDLDAIRAAALSLWESLETKPATFKVTTKRGWKGFTYDTLELNHLVGSHILRAAPELKVDVRNPEMTLHVDIQPEGAYIYNRNEPGAGGFPHGSNGKAMLLLSGGIDSPVAGWSALRKGLELELIHYHSYPFTSEQATDKVIELARQLSLYSGKPLKLHLVPFTDVQTRFTQTGQEHLTITLMRRSMLRIAGLLAERSGAGAIVSGDSLGQVASQTLGSMNVIGRTLDIPLLRPLIMMDKQEIIDRAVKIGTYTTSILPFEDCCTLFVPKSPSTNPNLNVVERTENGIPELDELIVKAADGVETVMLDWGKVFRRKEKTVLREAEERDWF
ncbi:tRNA 4-thiouridine(8) synthase ThiI [Paenibacillus pasadenensis]|uniref:tRNA uracil 4-sulfurtransferase ThiI n=1 Tax=Paenibacillus pasadenensis TaxID=217090 RepID=UPI00203C9480|nr:tRNA uracil 4-sulfurtransferase ThiI [Paenibacillus pasadenensis]MCM3746342.1 tRNA 4-thiouridine(8) synthase ThiI [Paenibacillus pasadenensis]